MENKITFSICIPNYNYANYIGETIDSILNQTFQDFEIIISDNASTDNSWDIIQNYVLKDKRIKSHINKINIGFAPNLQKCASLCTGDYIIMLSSDDLIKKNALEEYFRLLRLNNFRKDIVIHSGISLIDGNSVVFGYYKRFCNSPINYYTQFYKTNDNLYSGDSIVNQGREVLQDAILNFKSPASFCSTLYSRELFENVEGYDTTYTFIPDSIFLFKLLNKNPIIIYCDQDLFSYRVHNNNQIAQANSLGAIKYQIDGYMLAINAQREFNLNVVPRVIHQSYIDNYCLKESLKYFKLGSIQRAVKILLFSFVTFSVITIKSKYFIPASILFILSPLLFVIFSLKRILHV